MRQSWFKAFGASNVPSKATGGARRRGNASQSWSASSPQLRAPDVKNPTHRATLLSKTVARPGASDAVTRPRAPPTRPLIARARWPGVEERAEPAMIAFTTATETLTAIGTLVTGGGVLYLRKQVEVASQASEEATRSARLQQA